MSAALPSLAHPRQPLPGEDPDVARLSAMVVALLGEVAVLTERLDTVERLLDARALVTRAAIEGFAPDPPALAQRDARRQRLVAAVLRPLRMAAEQQADAGAAR